VYFKKASKKDNENEKGKAFLFRKLCLFLLILKIYQDNALGNLEVKRLKRLAVEIDIDIF
jgi:hypothetical protein